MDKPAIVYKKLNQQVRKSPSVVSPIKVMLSGRNLDIIPDGKSVVTLSEVRRQIQQELMDERFCGQQLLEVWINEEEGAESGDNDAWERCLAQINRADLVIVIYNGNAGWTRNTTGPGICHAEMAHCLHHYPAKLRLVKLRFQSNKALKLVSPDEVAAKTKENKEFADFVASSNLFCDFAQDRSSLIESVKLAVAKTISDYAVLALAEMRKGKFYLGSPLDWSRLSFDERKKALETAVQDYTVRIGATRVDKGLIWTMGHTRLLLRAHGVPSSFGVSEARERVGRPYLSDHSTTEVIQKEVVGPVHIIACHKRCTESQIISYMGHPDLFIVQAPFGFFVADQLSFVQTFFLLDCRDETATHAALQSMIDWIRRSGEGPRIVERAKSRATILHAQSKEILKLGGI